MGPGTMGNLFVAWSHTLNDLKKDEVITQKERSLLLHCILEQGDDDSEDDASSEDVVR